MIPVRTAPVFAFDSIDSTNDEAFRLLRAGSRPPFWVTAREQTRGRGRESRPWLSPPGNLYASCALNPAVPPRDAAGLSLVAALAAHDALEPHLPTALSTALRLKWPNDLMLGAAKLGGILLETSRLSHSAHPAVVIGIGLNLAIAPELSDRATASAHLDPAGGRTLVFQSLQSSLESRCAEWDEGRGFDAIRSAWLGRAYRLGEKVNVRVHGEVLNGVFCGIDRTGALELVTASGQIRRVLAGEVHAPHRLPSNCFDRTG